MSQQIILKSDFHFLFKSVVAFFVLVWFVSFVLCVIHKAQLWKPLQKESQPESLLFIHVIGNSFSEFSDATVQLQYNCSTVQLYSTPVLYLVHSSLNHILTLFTSARNTFNRQEKIYLSL